MESRSSSCRRCNRIRQRQEKSAVPQANEGSIVDGFGGWHRATGKRKDE